MAICNTIACGVSVTGSGYVGLRPGSSKLLPLKNSVSWSSKTSSNGSKTLCMKTWNPMKNRRYETLSYLEPLSDDSIAKQIDYMLKKGWIPALEFDEEGRIERENSRRPGYYDGRYWTLWKLPMFGCSDSGQVMREIEECRGAYPNAYIRCMAFDSSKQTQCISFLIHKPQPQAVA
ncbi:PREDICTED: ribulose bisphosphate carboxylase small chain clone 512-like isoform X1 [Tarenaya hassleriana]|uniref:ribulose bisphosphate carboxylase small chain clone 512-like isoform X1 n=1 Tax=Tarenaya hassleriana TaxID=28532 RepID=UPI00053C880D|nr:PREDICTED: ribulose bisphosphate carboxylase small chain clone 512-like isoform X1 [Tarenaya hassleriana]